MFRPLLLLSLVGGVCAEDAFTPPLIGYLFADGVRPMVGSPGAARILPPLAIETAFGKVAMAPGHQFGIASLLEGGRLALVRFGIEPVLHEIADTIPAFELVAFNRAGTAVAVYSAECGCIQVITGLPHEPVLSNSIEVSSVTAMALSGDGSKVAYSRESETVTSVGEHWPVNATALAYSPDDSTLAMVDAERKSVSLADTEIRLLADGLNGPAGIWFADSATVLLADGPAVRAIHIETGEINSTECPCRASVVEPTAMPGVFRVSGLAHGSAWILERTEENSRALFVPEQALENEQ